MGKIEEREAVQLVKDYYFKYAKYSLESRSIPSIYDGLKAGQRRLIYCASKLPNGKLTKSSKIIGDTLPYHPHSPDSLYGTLVGMTTPTNRFRQFDGSGNWGGPGFGAAAIRYTEAALSELSRFCYTQFIDYVDFVEGESGFKEPPSLPALIPYSNIVGSEGIGCGLATNIMPLNLMEMIDYFIAVLKGQEPVIPTPDFGNFILDMSDEDIDEAVSHYWGRVTVQSIITQEQENLLVIEDLYNGKGRGNKSIGDICYAIRDLIDSGKVDFRDETTDQIRYVFEIVDSSVDVNVLRKKLEKMTRRRKSFTRLVVRGSDAIYSDLRFQVDSTISYLRAVLKNKFSRDLEKLMKDEKVLLAVESIKSSGVLDEIVDLTRDELKSRVIELGFEDDIVNEAIRKPITYLTKSHQGEIEDIRSKIKEIQEIEINDYMISLYEEFRQIAQPLYDSYGHTVRRSRLLESPKVSYIGGNTVRVSNEGLDFSGKIFAASKNGWVTPVPIESQTKKDIELNWDIVGIASPDVSDIIVTITNEGGILSNWLDDIKYNKNTIKLEDGEEVVEAFGVGKNEDGNYIFEYDGKEYNAEAYTRVRISRPKYGWRK